LATWLVDHDIMWPLDTNAPWFLFTHYPEQNDVFSWLDGTMIIAYILATGVVYGTVLLALLAGATRTLGRFDMTRLHHLAQALIPIAGTGVFL
ncbi:4Fe-4S binding protein, partial [Burkholderia sp. SIMBA_057]